MAARIASNTTLRSPWRGATGLAAPMASNSTGQGWRDVEAPGQQHDDDSIDTWAVNEYILSLDMGEGDDDMSNDNEWNLGNEYDWHEK